MVNTEIKNQAAEAGIRLWQIAERLGMNDGNFSRLFRKELCDEKRAEINEIIGELKAGIATCSE